MKHTVYFIIIHYLITASTCTAMEQELDLKKWNLFAKPTILSEIAIIQEPWQAEYLNNDRVLINGKNGCCIIDSKTNQVIKKIDVQAKQFAIHPTQKKICFAQKKPAIYSCAGDLKRFINISHFPESTYFENPIFNPLKTKILFTCKTGASSSSTSFNYATDKHHTEMASFASGSYHPTQKKIYLILSTTERRCVSIHLNESKLVLYYMPNHYDNNPDDILCSPNGLTIAIRTKNSIDISDDMNYCIKKFFIELPTINNRQLLVHPITKKNIPISQDSDIDTWVDMLFHPNSAVLATAIPFHVECEPYQVVFYWDIHTQELITTSPLIPTNSHHHTKNIAFSPDGRNLMIILPNQCAILSVPFEVMYDTTGKKPHLYWFLLKETTNQYGVPNDAQRIIMCSLLEAKFKR